MYTLFKKEFRQHGFFVPAVIVICTLLQLLLVAVGLYLREPVPANVLFFCAMIASIIYAGVAAGLTYSTEHADKTFAFLRGLPISPTMLAVGKIGWALCGTALVLSCTLLISAGLVVYQGQEFDGFLTMLCNEWRGGTEFSFLFIEVFVWGIFWSTICRKQTTAVVGSFVCPLLVCWVLTLVALHDMILSPGTEFDFMMRWRIAVTGIVLILAVRQALCWFAQEKKSFFITRIEFRNAMLFRYPKHVQPPMLALIHQHIRHASLLYSFGILCFIIFGCGCLFLCMTLCMTDGDIITQNIIGGWWWPLGMLIGSLSPFIFWGSIFGHDQKNDSYRYLSRIGIHEGKVWWSRMLPPLPFYAFAGLGLVCWCFADMDATWQWTFEQLAAFKMAAPMAFAVWLSIPVLGAFGSISCRSQIVAVFFTFLGTYFIGAWGVIILALFGCNALWTTLPVVLAILVVARIRAGYWLREKLNGRARLLTWLPVFGTMLAILIALPFVRVYSVPYISWQQIETYFKQANMQGTYEEFLSVNYSVNAATGTLLASDLDNAIYRWIVQSPWESARRERLLRVRMVALLADSEPLAADQLAVNCKRMITKVKLTSPMYDCWLLDVSVPNVPEANIFLMKRKGRLLKN